MRSLYGCCAGVVGGHRFVRTLLWRHGNRHAGHHNVHFIWQEGNHLTNHVTALGIALSLALTCAAQAQVVTAPPVPTNIEGPAPDQAFLLGRGVGTQNLPVSLRLPCDQCPASILSGCCMRSQPSPPERPPLCFGQRKHAGTPNGNPFRTLLTGIHEQRTRNSPTIEETHRCGRHRGRRRRIFWRWIPRRAHRRRSLRLR